jgi:hypothetical protein
MPKKYKIIGYDTFSHEYYEIRDDNLEPRLFDTLLEAETEMKKHRESALESASSPMIADRYWIEGVET